MLVHIKEISKKKNKTDFSQHSCTNVFAAVADLQVQCLYIYICIYQAVKYTVLVGYLNLLVSALGECCIGMINLTVLVRYLRRGLLGSEEDILICPSASVLGRFST